MSPGFLAAGCVLFMIPMANAANDTIISGWVQDPSNTRGTFSILSSCVLTLVLCVYTALHANIGHHGRSTTYSWLSAAKWITIGVLAPELLCFVAWRQWVSARSITHTVKDLKARNIKVRDAVLEETRTIESNKIVWTSTHSQYANMGGFVVQFDDDYLKSNTRFTSKVDRLTLTPRGVRLLLECGFVPNISKEEILDKSKTDNLAKILSLLQASWQLVQILARLRAGLQITLLEINTLAHIICAFIIYGLWWQKPKDIREPTKLRGEWLGPVMSYMFMSSQVSGWKARDPGILTKTWKEPEFSILGVRPDIIRPDSSVESLCRMETLVQQDTFESLFHADYDLQENCCTTAIIPKSLEHLRSRSIDDSSNLKLINSCLQSSADLRYERWRLASEAIRLYPHITAFLKSGPQPNHHGSPPYLHPELQELVLPSLPNWPDDSLLRDNVSGFSIGVVLWSVSIFYGGLHASAWNEFFPSTIEQYMWRISCIWIAASGLIWVGCNFLASISLGFHGLWEKVERLQARWWVVMPLGGAAVVCGTGYLAARAFLVVEGFVSLRMMPQAAFDTPAWTQVIPHL